MKPFTAPATRVLGWVWLAVVALLMVDLALNGRDHSALVAAAVLLITAGGAYVLWLRPRVVPTAQGVRVVNPFRDTLVPWPAFTWADVTDVLRVHAGDRVVRSWPLRETKRTKVRDNLRRADDRFALDDDADPRDMRPVDLVARRLREEAQKRKAQPGTVGGGAAGDASAVGEPTVAAEPTTVWAPDAVAALAVPVFLLVMVVLLG